MRGAQMPARGGGPLGQPRSGQGCTPLEATAPFPWAWLYSLDARPQQHQVAAPWTWEDHACICVSAGCGGPGTCLTPWPAAGPGESRAFRTALPDLTLFRIRSLPDLQGAVSPHRSCGVAPAENRSPVRLRRGRRSRHPCGLHPAPDDRYWRSPDGSAVLAG